MDEKILNTIRRKMEADEKYMQDCTAYDDMDDMRWTMPTGLEMREWVRKRVSTDAHDILKTATNLFDTHNPRWSVLPRGPVDADRAEEIERWIEWFMRLANQNSDSEVFRMMLKHATKYNRICAQIEYEPYWLDKQSQAYKEALINPFSVVLHYPANVHYGMGKRLQWVAAVSNVCATDCLEKWTEYESNSEYGKQVKSGLNKIRALVDDDESEDEVRLMYVDYTDKDTRWVFAYRVDDESVDDDLNPPEGKELIEIFNGKNELGFINWVISSGTSDPLLYSLHHGGLWENQNFLDTIADSTIIRRGFFPLFKHKSVSGKPLDVDYTGMEGSVELSVADGEEAEILNPPPLDQGIRELMDRNSARGASATGLKGLQNINITGNVQYASIQAMIQVSKSTLDPYIRIFEKAGVELVLLCLKWVQKSGDTLTAYRAKSKGQGKVAGQKINIGAKDFDPKTMSITCELLSANPGDEMQRMNVFNMARQIGVPITGGEIAERMGWGDENIMRDDFIKEKLQEMALALFQKQQDLQLQMMAQQAMQQVQQPPQPPPGMSPPSQGAPNQPALEAAQGQGNNPAAMGTPPTMTAPPMTQTATRGQP